MKKPKSASDLAPGTMPSGYMIDVSATESETVATGSSSNIGLEIADMPAGGMMSATAPSAGSMPAGSMASAGRSG